MTVPAGSYEGVWDSQRRNPKRRMRLLCESEQRSYILEGVKPAIHAEIRLLQQSPYLLHPFLKALLTLVQADSEVSKFVRQEGLGESDF